MLNITGESCQCITCLGEHASADKLKHCLCIRCGCCTACRTWCCCPTPQLGSTQSSVAASCSRETPCTASTLGEAAQHTECQCCTWHDSSMLQAVAHATLIRGTWWNLHLGCTLRLVQCTQPGGTWCTGKIIHRLVCRWAQALILQLMLLLWL
jgi:hypothetical protein